jgi:hypothetical protein
MALVGAIAVLLLGLIASLFAPDRWYLPPRPAPADLARELEQERAADRTETAQARRALRKLEREFTDHRALCEHRRVYIVWLSTPFPTIAADPFTFTEPYRAAMGTLDARQVAELAAMRSLEQSAAGFRRIGSGGWVVSFRWWLLQATLGGLLAIVSWLAWREIRGPNPCKCQNCGYDRTGLARNARCPECGSEAREAPVRLRKNSAGAPPCEP